MYRTLGFAHATAYHHLHRARTDQEGQGTVEYIGLILLLAGVMAIVVKSADDKSIASKVVDEIKGAIDSVGTSRK
jgi:hypothetical protein